MTISQSLTSIEEYMALPWKTEIHEDADGGVVLSVWPLSDFAVYGDTVEEVEAEWRSALRSHLLGYIALNKRIPTGNLDVSVGGATRSSWTIPVPA